MKKFLSIIISILFTQVSDAQVIIKAGTVQLGGSINYNRQQLATPNAISTAQDITTKTLLISPSAGYLVRDNLAVGISFTYLTSATIYSSSSGATIYNNDYRQRQISAGPFVQYYQMLTQQFGLVGTLTANYTRDTGSESLSSNNAPSNTITYSRNGFLTGLTPGIIFFPISKFALGASFGSLAYSYAVNNGKGNIDGKSTYSTFGANFGLNQFTFSGTYYFGQ